MSDRPPYDPDARRDTPLALKLKARIRETGPIPLRDYMAACLADPEHGYYTTKAGIGRAGDFVTAPEISQVFGELIGLWAAVVWQQMGAPARFNLVELGPGRGTLMSDALRATRIVPGFHDAACVVLVDIAPAFAATVHSVPGGRLTHVSDISGLPADAPAIVIANEFLDTCPAQQFVVAGRSCGLRAVGVVEERLAFVTVPRDEDDGDDAALLAANPALTEGDLFETLDLTALHRLAHGRPSPWAGLFIDYGHFDPARGAADVARGETLQAVRGHAYEHPLTSPGEADLTCHVDFNDVKHHLERAGAGGLAVDGPVTQAEFLGRLGIIERATRLMCANPARAGEIEADVARLIAPGGMGTRFKVLGARSATLPPLPGF